MGMFNMSGTKGVKVSTGNGANYLRAGIHTVTFTGLNKSEKANAIEFHFEGEDGAIHNELLFEPRSAERTQSQFGTNPSEAEQFTCKVKQIIDALNPELGKMIDEQGEKFDAPNFDAFIALLKKHLDSKVGATTQIKLLPTSGNFVGMPGFPARVSKDGGLYMTTKIIGADLTLTTAEKNKIETAATARPTQMSAATELDDLKDDFEAVDSDDDEMPF